jgi:hypothetical protein
MSEQAQETALGITIGVLSLWFWARIIGRTYVNRPANGIVPVTGVRRA